ncbi:MAG TPA: hypothetical protein PK771_05445 [Spirochaetota bacterium]|nr:hypothetical protein [Spirochaetota bacterium]
MESNICVFFSSLKEANSILFQSGIKFSRVNDIHYEVKDTAFKIIIYISGIGKDKTLDFIDEIPVLNDFIYFKFGTCGVLDDKIDLLKVFIPQYACYGAECLKIGKFSNLSHVYSESKLLTLDTPLYFENQSVSYLKSGYSFVDMESYHLVKKFNAIPVLVGTDRCNSDSKNDFLKNLNISSGLLKDFFLKEFYAKD